MNFTKKSIHTLIFIIGTTVVMLSGLGLPASATTLTIHPTSGTKNAPINVSGDGYQPGSTITIQYLRNGTAYSPDTVITADGKGKFKNAIIHAQGPFNVRDSSYTVQAFDSGGQNSASSTFTQVGKAKAPTDLTPISRNSGAEFVGNNGDIVGEQDVDSSQLLFSNNPAKIVSRAFVVRDGILVPLSTLGGSASAALGFNKRGLIVGEAQIAGDSESHAVVFNKDGTIKDLGTLGGKTSFATAINDRGKIVGVSQVQGNSAFRGFIYSGGQKLDLGTLGGSSSDARGINKRKQIVGTSNLSGNTAQHAYLFTQGVMKDLGTLGGTNSFGDALNNNGDVTGCSNTVGSTNTHTFLYSGGLMKDLGTLGGLNSLGFSINSFGDVVGTAQTKKGSYHAVIYIAGQAPFDLNNLLPSHSGWILIDAKSINDHGQIVGVGKFKNKKKGFLLNLIETQ